MYEYIISALIFGLTAGLKPGPLGIIVIQQTLQHGFKNGIKASLAPIITDGPIIILSFFILTQFSDISIFIAILSFLGGLYLLFLTFKILNIKNINISKSLNSSNSLSTAIKINFLSPNPYLFWFTVGGTYIISGTQFQAIAFITVAIGTLVLSKIFIAWIASNFRYLLDSKIYLFTMYTLGILLSIFGFILLIKSYIIFLS